MDLRKKKILTHGFLAELENSLVPFGAYKGWKIDQSQYFRPGGFQFRRGNTLHAEKSMSEGQIVNILKEIGRNIHVLFDFLNRRRRETETGKSISYEIQRSKYMLYNSLVH